MIELFDRYKEGNATSIWQLKARQAAGDTGSMTPQENWLLKYSQPTNVKVIGVWDTVGSVGLAAGNFEGISRSQFDYLQTGLRIQTSTGYHALAIDEHRNDFAPTLWDVHHPEDSKASHRGAAPALRRRTALVCRRPRKCLGVGTRPIFLHRLPCAG